MTAAHGIESAVEWLRRQGHHLVLSDSACWYDAAPRVFQAFPHHPVINPPEDELRLIFKKTRALALRYSAPLDSPVGKLSYHVVYNKPTYGFEQVTRQTRQNIRKGLEHATYEPVSFTRLANEGWALRRETLARQGRHRAENEAWWKRLCLSAAGLPGFEALGAFREGKLLGAIIAYLARGHFLLLYQQSLTEHLKHGVNNALGFVFTQKALSRPDVSELFYGFESLDASWQVDEFKLRMGYTPEPVRQRVLFHPVLHPLARPATLAAMEYLVHKGAAGPRWLKATGMMRFYLEGKLPVRQQSWPPCLVERTEDLSEKTS